MGIYLLSKPISLLRLADKELQRKSLEDSLNSERSCGANRETKMQVCDHRPQIFPPTVSYVSVGCRGTHNVGPFSCPPSKERTAVISVASFVIHCLLSFLGQALHNENMSLKAEIQKLQAQISDQVRNQLWLFKNAPMSLCCFVSLYPLVFSVQAASQLAMDQIQKRCV